MWERTRAAQSCRDTLRQTIGREGWTPREQEGMPEQQREPQGGLTEMDGQVTEGDKPEAGGNIEADNKGRED